MSEKSQEILLGSLIEPPEFDADGEELEQRYAEAFYKSSKIDIQDNLNKIDFKNTWLVLKSDIQNQPIQFQRIFAEQMIDKISDVYDYRFPLKISLDTEPDLNIFYEFLEFLEYDNIKFISSIWKFVNQVNLMRFDIKTFCKTNKNIIIKEIDEQADIYVQNELVLLFLKSCPVDVLINWFITHSERNRIDITVNILS